MSGEAFFWCFSRQASFSWETSVLLSRMFRYIRAIYSIKCRLASRRVRAMKMVEVRTKIASRDNIGMTKQNSAFLILRNVMMGKP